MNEETSEKHKTEQARIQQLLKTGKIEFKSKSFKFHIVESLPTDPKAYEIKDGKIFIKPEYLKDLC